VVLCARSQAATGAEDYYDAIPEDHSVDGEDSVPLVDVTAAEDEGSTCPMGPVPSDPAGRAVRNTPQCAPMPKRPACLAQTRVAQAPVYEPPSAVAGAAPARCTLMTATSVLNYLMCCGQAARKRLFYLNPRPPRDALEIVSPFDLVVVSREARGAHHFTMTLSGVSELHGDREADFTSLGEWMRLSRAAELTFELPFFRKYRCGPRCHHRCIASIWWSGVVGASWSASRRVSFGSRGIHAASGCTLCTGCGRQRGSGCARCAACASAGGAGSWPPRTPCTRATQRWTCAPCSRACGTFGAPRSAGLQGARSVCTLWKTSSASKPPKLQALRRRVSLRLVRVPSHPCPVSDELRQSGVRRDRLGHFV
jgi:hypothetical protein